MLIELPSGLQGEARKIRGAEAIELAERAGQAGGNSLGSILRGCWQRTIDPGPYAHTVVGEQALDWNRVLKGDLLAGLIALRAASIPSVRDVPPGEPWPGKQYSFYVQCERCQTKYGWTVNDIVHDLPRRELSPESVEQLRAGKPFTATATDDDGHAHELTFDLMLPEQDDVLRVLLKTLNRKRITTVESLAAQTRTVNGKAMAPVFRQRFFAQLPLGELNRLRDLFDTADCGIDLDFETRCTNPDCGWEQDVTLPFDKTFWRPDLAPAKKAPEPSPDPEA